MHHRVDVVVVLERAVAGEADRDRLVTAVHRHEVDVDVDEQIGLRGPLRDLDHLVLVRGADLHQGVLVLAVEVVEVLRPERTEDPLAHHPTDLVGGHPTVQGSGDDDLHVLDTVAGGQLDHLLEDPLPDVGQRHRRQRDRDVVHGDRELHAGLEQVGKRLGVPRGMQQGVTDRGVDVPDPGQSVRRVHDPRPQRELLHAEALALVDQERGRPFVHLQHESGSGHEVVSPVLVSSS